MRLALPLALKAATLTIFLSRSISVQSSSLISFVLRPARPPRATFGMSSGLVALIISLNSDGD